MNLHSASELLFRDFVKLAIIGIGFGGGYFIDYLNRESLKFGSKGWQKACIYLEGVAACILIAFYENMDDKHLKPETIELFVLSVIPCLLGIMMAQEEKKPTRTN